MRKKLPPILFVMMLLTSCDQYSPPSNELILNSLKIHTWVLDDQYEGHGVWEYEEATRENGFLKNEGYWITEDGVRLTGDDVFVYDRLEFGKPRILAPMGFNYMDNVNFHISCDDYVEVELLTDEGNNYALISHSFENPEAPWDGGREISTYLRALAPTVVTFHPYGKFWTDEHLYRHTLADQEYYLAIRTYDGDGTQIIEAKLKLVAIEDDSYPYPDEGTRSSNDWSIYSVDDNMTRFLSVELIEYGFSEQYRMEYGITDSEESETTDIMVVGY